MLAEHPVNGIYFWPSWSHDGTRMAVLNWDISDGDLLQVIDDLNDPQPRTIISEAQLGASMHRPDFSRTGARIVFGSGGNLYTVDADLGLLVALNAAGSAAAWSPTDSHLVFEGPASPGSTRKIRLLDMATNQATTIAGDRKISYRYPHWRPF
jgi:Tol biopolymer transport system component